MLRRMLVVMVGALLLAGSASWAGCSTDAVGIDACRQIEDARCELAPQCPDLKVTDVDACKRFYRDQCLHGLAVADPGTPVIDKCIKALRIAGTCTTGGADTCGVALAPTSTIKVTCDVVAHPEVLADCVFLSSGSSTSTDPTLTDGGTDAAAGAAGTAGAAGAAGTAGAAGAAAGAAGAAGASEEAGAGGTSGAGGAGGDAGAAGAG